jgi:tripartite-type tricarboxylate transporter receptor subunit TctC
MSLPQILVMLATAGAAAFAVALPLNAQTYPTRPIRVIVPYAPGGGSDILARLLQQKTSEDLGQQLVIDNRPGAASTLGTQLIARAVPDGYTIGMIDTALVINPGLFPKLPYDAAKDFAPITVVATSPLVFAVHPSVPASNLKQLVALVKAKPGVLNFSSAGNGSASHLAGEQFRAVAGIDIVHVPYKGAGPQAADIVAGQSMMGFTTPASIMPHVRAGKVRAFGISGPKRSPSLPGLPTFIEQGFVVDAMPFWALVAPAGTPKEIIARLNKAIVKQIRTPEFRDRLIELAFDPVGNTPEEFGTLIRTEIPKWKKVIQDAGVKVE